MGFKLEGEKFIKTPKDTSRDENPTSAQTKATPSQISNEMILNLLMRIDGKLTDQSARIQKIEDNLQELGNLMKEKGKSPFGPTTEDLSAAPSLAIARQTAENPAFQVEGDEPESIPARKQPTPEVEIEEKDSDNTKVIGSFNDNYSQHDEAQTDKPSPANSEEILIMDVFHQMVREDEAKNEVAKSKTQKASTQKLPLNQFIQQQGVNKLVKKKGMKMHLHKINPSLLEKAERLWQQRPSCSRG